MFKLMLIDMQMIAPDFTHGAIITFNAVFRTKAVLAIIGVTNGSLRVHNPKFFSKK